MLQIVCFVYGYGYIAQLVERHFYMVNVIGSNPIVITRNLCYN